MNKRYRSVKIGRYFEKHGLQWMMHSTLQKAGVDVPRLALVVVVDAVAWRGIAAADAVRAGRFLRTKKLPTGLKVEH